MGSYIGQCDDFVNRYLAEGLQGFAAASQHHSTTQMAMNNVLNGHTAGTASYNHPHVAHASGRQHPGNVKREQDSTALESLTSSKDSAATQQAMHLQARQQSMQRQSSAPTDHAPVAVPRFASAFSLPSGMIPTPVTAAMSTDGVHPASMSLGYSQGHQVQQPQQWMDTCFAASQAQLLSLQQAAQQQGFAASLSASAVGNPAAAAAPAANGFTMRSNSQALSSNSVGAPPASTDDEPDLSHLTVMQRYHARRKLAVQRMEREVELKIAQLALLEQENRKLKWQAHILENMLLDIDKQLEVMSTSEAGPDASQWLTLLGMGQPSANSGRVARTVHRMLEGAGQVDVSGWTVQDCRSKWIAYVKKLRPLVEAADAAQQEYRAKQPTSAHELNSGNGAGGRRPRRAAAAAAAAVIQQEAADVLGLTPILPNAIPEPPPPLSSSPTAAAAALGDKQVNGQSLQPSPHRSSSDAGDQQSYSSGSDTANPAYAASIEGIPQPLLQQIDQLVLENFYWLLAMMTTNPVLTYEFISMDLEEGSKPLPPQEHKMWQDVVNYVQPTLDQLQECSTCIQVSRRCMAKVMEERAEIQESMHCSVESGMHTHLSEEVLQLNSRDAAVERMRANVRKESVVRNMVGFYCINVFSLFQLARVSVACFPWFCMAWRVVGAIDERLTQQLADLARTSGRNGGSNGHNTRSSARLAAQR